MIRIITYLMVYVFGISLTLAQIQSEEILINNQAIQLPGTLTFSSEQQALIIWVHGSGGVDRNGNQPNYIKQFRDAINKENIAFFSYDKRIVNPKNAIYFKDGIYITDFISDLKEVISHFKKDKRFSKIIVAGHSQGSLIGMMALKNVDKYISIAGTGETIDKTLLKQIKLQSPNFVETTKSHLKELKETGEIKNVNPNLMMLFAKPNQDFFLSWMALDPLEEIKKVKIPTLIINGDKDIQVQTSDARKLKEAKPNAELVIIKNMNHVLKDIQKEEDNMNSYYSSEYPISKELIETIVLFVKK